MFYNKKNYTLTVLFLVSFSFAQTKDYSDTNFTSGIEGPAFLVDDLYVVNYKSEGTIGVISPNRTTRIYISLPNGSVGNSIVFDKQGSMFIADYKNHNILICKKGQKEASVYVHSKEFNQPNDICLSTSGNFYASDPNWSASTGKLWLVDKDKNVVLIDSSMGTTNGIALSPKEKYLYVNESVQRVVWKYTLAKNGRAVSRQLFYRFNDYGMDGMKTDDEGNLYIARYGAGNIAVLNPKGKLLAEIPCKREISYKYSF